MRSLELEADEVGKKWFWRGAAIGVWLLNFLVLIGLLAYVYGILKLPPSDDLDESIHADYAARDQPKNPRSGIVSGKSNSNANAVEDNNDKKQKALERLIEIRDLKAQEGMWAVAFLLVVITFFQFLASLVGLYYILKTYRETRSAAYAAVKAYEVTEYGNKVSLQPYIDIKGFKLHWDSSLRYTRSLTLRLKVVNRGKSIVTSITDVEITKCNLALIHEGEITNQSDFFVLKDVSATHEGPINAVILPGGVITFRKVMHLYVAELEDTDWKEDLSFIPIQGGESHSVFQQVFRWKKLKKMINMCDIEGRFEFSDQFSKSRKCKFSIARFTVQNSGATKDLFDPISASIIEVDLKDDGAANKKNG